ncbi:MAG: DUF983 domain-containing protein [Pseudomonadota bacterium]
MSETPLTFGGTADRRPVWTAIGRGTRGRCPQCGEGKLFRAYLKPANECSNCGLDFTGHQADDAPPYATLFVVGKITIPGALFVERYINPPLWIQFALWTPILIFGSLWFLPISKGALIGLQWANRMHGFDPDGGEGFEDGAPAGSQV